MSPQVVAALVAGGFGIVTPIITFLAIQWFTGPGLPMSKGRRKAINGSWHGTFHQEVGPGGQPLDGDYSLQLSTSRRTIKGDGGSRCQIGDKKYESRFAVVGGFLHERFLRLNYDRVDETALQLGSLMLELGDDGLSLRGRFIAYGFLSQRLIYGSIELTKEP